MAILSFIQEIRTELSPTAVVISSILLLTTSVLTYYCFFDPLRNIPGPLKCRVTPFWTWYHSYVGDECRLIHDMFTKYGPVLRVAPNEVVISDGAALAPIYSEKGGFLKAPCYSNFDFEGHSTIFSTQDSGHRHIRSKAVLPLFSIGNIRSGMGDIEKCVQQFVTRVRREADESRSSMQKTGKPVPVNVLNLTRSLSIDSVSAYLFGQPYGGIEEETGKMSASGFVDSAVAIGRVFYFPNWLFRAFEVFIDICFPADRHVSESVEKVNKFADRLVASSGENDNTYQGRLLKAGISSHETEVQCKDLLFAGTDSTGANLAKLMWYLAQKPDAYKTLRAEILRADQEDPDMNPQAIPYLDAVVREGLRLSMANPSRFPRQVPPTGFTFTAHEGESFYLPPGTLVGLQSYSLHFNPDVFPDAFAFKPERWIDNPTSEMQRDWFPFGLGQRQCIARNLAHTELLLTMRAIARANLLDGAKAVSEKIEILEWFNSKVVGEKIELVWT